MENTNRQKSLFFHALMDFLMELDGLNASMPVIIESIKKLDKNASKEIYKLLIEKGEKGDYPSENTQGEVAGESVKTRELYYLNFDYHYKFRQLMRNAQSYDAANRLIPGSFMVTMVSQYDAFLGSIIKDMFYAKPEMIDASERNLKFADLLQFGSIEAARESVVEKEVEGVLRESHSDHFEWLEKKLGIPLRKDLNIWLDFIELTERRNLFVHTGGVVSSQYLNVCKKQGIVVNKEYKIGTTIEIDTNYLEKAYETLYELSVKLSHVIWRKLLPAELHEADIALNDVCYNLLIQEKYGLASRILAFALSLPKHEFVRDKLVFTVNHAIALKWGGEPEKAKKILTEMDLSAYRDDFILAANVLLDNFDDAAQIMRKIGKSGLVKKADYKDWPAFKEFRKSPEFRSAYQEIFDELFETVLISEETTADGRSETTVTVVEDDDSNTEVEDSNADNED